MRGAFRHKFSQRKRWTSSVNSQSGLRAQRFPLVSSPKETSRWEKVRRRWWCARKSHDVVQRTGGRLLWLGDTEAGSKALDNAGDYVEKWSCVQAIHWQCGFCKLKCCTCLRPLYLYSPDTPRTIFHPVVLRWISSELERTWKEAVWPEFEKRKRRDSRGFPIIIQLALLGLLRFWTWKKNTLSKRPYPPFNTPQYHRRLGSSISLRIAEPQFWTQDVIT